MPYPKNHGPKGFPDYQCFYKTTIERSGNECCKQINKKTKKSILGLSTFFEYCFVSFLIILFSVLWTLTLTFEQSLKLFTSYSCDWQTDWQTDRKLQYIGYQLYGSKKWFISKIDFVISTDLLFSYMEIIIIINFKNITYLSL